MKPTLKPITPSTHASHTGHPPTHPPIPPPTIRTLKIPPSKAWCSLHRANATSAHRVAHRANATSPRIASRTTTAQRIAQYNDRASHPVQRPRIANNPSTVQRAARTYNQPAAHRPPRSAHRPSRSAHASHYFALGSFRLVRGTNFSKIQYIYIFIFQMFMTHLVYWLRCENLICGPRFDSGTSRVIVVGPRRRPCCNDDFTTAEK